LQRPRNTLVVAEVALAIVLLVGAGLMIQSVRKLAAIDPGFDPTSVLTVHGQRTASVVFADRYTRRTSAPCPHREGRRVCSNVFAPFQGLSRSVSATTCAGRHAGAGFYVAEGQGTFTAKAVIVSECVAARFWPNQNPIGKHLKFGAINSDVPWLSIVGVHPVNREAVTRNAPNFSYRQYPSGVCVGGAVIHLAPGLGGIGVRSMARYQPGDKDRSLGMS